MLGYALLLDSDRYQAFSMGKAMQYAFLRKIKIDNYILLVFSVKNAITGFLLDFILDRGIGFVLFVCKYSDINPAMD